MVFGIGTCSSVCTKPYPFIWYCNAFTLHFFIFLFRRNFPHWAILLSGFIMGVVIDTFTNTPGVSSASLTLIAAVQPYVLR
ncbi:rod shape-determining protein MreD, partial [Prevotella disiens]|uniref:rod shape-determining protein MreD n=1 Tax=Prevotella disiens TaxID=28130 RepID=UPI0015593FF4